MSQTYTVVILVVLLTLQDYIYQVDPTASLGLSCDSLHSYQLTQGGRRVLGGDKPQSSPSRYLGNGPGRIVVSLKGECPPYSDVQMLTSSDVNPFAPQE